MPYCRYLLTTLVLILLGTGVSSAQMAYDPGDWTSWRDFRFARALDAGTHELFVATSGGVLIYDLYRQRWQDPIAVGYGLSQPVPVDDAQLLLFDEETGYLWVATRTQLLQYDVNADRWQVVHTDLWAPGERVVNMGVGGSEFYLETLPAQLYDRLFPPGSPLPVPDWQGFVTRYKGSRNFGSLMRDLDDAPDAGEIQWRGLRSKRPLTQNELFGNLGLPPLNFPTLLLPGGWIWHADGTLLDPDLRTYLITDWVVDRFGNLWASFWGGGVLQGDLRGGRVEIHAQGPAGNDIRALSLDGSYWMGGFDSGEGQGLTQADPELRTWRSFQTRDNSRIRSTNVFDIARWDGSLWFATDEGLLEYQEKKGQWKLYTVGEGLQSDHVRALVASDTALWIGNSSGLALVGAKSRKVMRIPVPQLGVTEVVELGLAGDTLYVSTAVGLYKAELYSPDFLNAPIDPGLLNATVVDIVATGNEVWMATPEGIQVYDPALGRTQSWAASDWMHNARPTSIALAGSFVWVGTEDQGFFRFDRGKGQWIGYTVADGLVDNRVHILRAVGDDLYIGTENGLSRFYWNRPGRPR